MKFTVVFIAALSVSASWAIKVKKEDEPKDKREAPIGYPSHSSHYQGSSLGHGDASAISVGAGYSVGGAKPSFSLGGHGGEGGYHLGSEGLPASGHATIQLAPITLQSAHGLASADLSQLMSQLSHGLNSGAITLQTGESYQPSAQGEHGGQELSLPQYTYGAPKIQQYNAAEQPSVPSYAAGTKGLGSYSTGPVLFSPSDSHGNAQQLTYGAPSAGHSLGGSSDSGHAFASVPASGHSFGHAPSAGHSFGSLSSSGLSSGGHSFGGQSFGEGSGHSLPPISLNDAVHSFGGLKGFGGGYGAPSKTSFKPSAFLGASSIQSDGHGLSALSGSYGAPSFGSFSSGSHGGLSSAGHGASLGGSFGGFGGGSSKFVAPSYLPPKSEGFGSLHSVASFASEGHASPPGTTYGVPSGSYLQSNTAHAASSSNPQFYVPSKSSYPGFGGGSSSFKAPYSGHSLSSFSSGPKHSFGGHSSYSHGHRYLPPKDVQGAHSETSYNTIKYSEELKPRVH